MSLFSRKAYDKLITTGPYTAGGGGGGGGQGGAVAPARKTIFFSNIVFD